MPKCWIHGPTENAEETAKKPLPEHPGFPDRTADYQKNLAMILSPFKPTRESLKTYRWWDFQVLTDELDKLKEGKKPLETKAKILLNKELSPEEINQELNNLKKLFNKADLPNTYALLEEICQQLLRVSQFFDFNDYDDKDSKSETSKDDEEDDEEKQRQEAKRKQEEDEKKQKEKKKAEEESKRQAEAERKQKEAEEAQTKKDQAEKLARKKAEQEKREREERERKTTEEPERAEKTNWVQVLQEIHNFANPKGFFNNQKRPTSLNQVKEFIQKYPDPLAGINLKGTTKDQLLKLAKDLEAQEQLKKAQGDFKDYQNWVALNSSSDGNCFLNSFSIFLNGNESLTVKLRVAVCFLLMKEPWRLGSVKTDTEQDNLNRLIDKLTVNKDTLSGKTYPLAKDKEFMYTDDINFLSVILKRPLRVLYFPKKEQFVSGSQEDRKKGEIAWKEFQQKTGGMAMLEFKGESRDSEKIAYDYEEYWTILNLSAIHFVPLINNANKKEEQKKEEIEIYFEPIAPVKLEEIKKMTGLMLTITYKMTVEVSERGEYRNEGVHSIGDAWKPSTGMINTYGEDDDPQPGSLEGKPLKRVILQGLGTISQDWEKAINKSKVKKGVHHHWKEMFKVRGKVESYNEATATLTFSEGADIEGILAALPL